MFVKIPIAALGAIALCVLAHDARAQEPDAEGCKDSPLISRMAGSSIDRCDKKEFDQVEMVTALKDGNQERKTFEGAVQTWTYTSRTGVTTIQIFRNIQTAIRRAGFSIDYESPTNDELTAHKGNTWYQLDNGGSGVYYVQTIVTVQTMQQEVTADASSLASEIEKSGHVAVYGIHFDTAKATIQPDSEKTLAQIVQLLADNPALKLRIEGYTDNVGQPAANQMLSEKRAQAVMTWLTAHGVAASRLAAKGLGVANPVAANTTEEGRAKNRRVELVKM
jgi:OOP family OmpA-OmpF porin